jgi:MFS family permease
MTIQLPRTAPTLPGRPPAAGPADLAREAARTTRLGVAAVLVATLGLGLAYGVGYTATTLQFEAWGTPGWLTGLAGAAPALAVLVVVPFAPQLGARLGVARAMALGAGLATLSYLLMPLLPTPGAWLGLRFLAGIGLTLPWLLGETWINLVTRDAVRGRVLAAYTVVLFGAWAAGPELLARLGSDGWTAPLLATLGMVIAVVPLVLARRHAPALAATGRVRPLAAVRLAPFAMAAALIGGVVEFGAISMLPVQALEAGLAEADALRLLTLLLVGGVALQPLVGWLADRMDRAVLLAGLGVALAGLGTLLVLAIATPTAAAIVVFLLGGVVMAFYSVGLTLLGEQVVPAQLVVANAAFLVSYEAGATGGPLLVGVTLDIAPTVGLGGVLVVAGLVYAVAVVRHRRQAGAVSRRPSPALPPGPAS